MRGVALRTWRPFQGSPCFAQVCWVSWVVENFYVGTVPLQTIQRDCNWKLAAHVTPTSARCNSTDPDLLFRSSPPNCKSSLTPFYPPPLNSLKVIFMWLTVYLATQSFLILRRCQNGALLHDYLLVTMKLHVFRCLERLLCCFLSFLKSRSECVSKPQASICFLRVSTTSTGRLFHSRRFRRKKRSSTVANLEA